MLKIIVPARELWDERTQEFINIKEQPLALEHSLVSLSRWESKWCKPFLTRQEKTREEIIDYVRCMTLTENVDPIIYEYLSEGNVKQINSYIDAPAALKEDLSLKNKENNFIAGQLSGVEGYVESAAMGIIAGINAYRKLKGLPFIPLSRDSVTGALIDYICHANEKSFAPMNASWVLFPTSKKDRRQETIDKALETIQSYWKSVNE